MSVKKNILANYLGQGWNAAAGLLFTPLYIKYLGMEAYGLIGFFGVMQTSLMLLDMGMTPTLNREMARYSAGTYSSQSISNLLRSVEIVALILVLLITILGLGGSGYLATDWLKLDTLSVDSVANAISIMMVVVALRFFEGIYRSSLFGLQQQVLYNSVTAILATVRHTGAVVVLAFFSQTIRGFFLWQLIMSVVTVTVLSRRVYNILPQPPLSPRFSKQAIFGVWRFASGSMMMMILSLLVSQADKVILSRMLSLQSYGYYTIAATLTSVLFLVVNPVVQAVYPRLVELHSRGEDAAVVSVYHRGAQIVTVLTAPATLLLSFFGAGIIFLWSGNPQLAQQSAPVLSVMVIGTFLNGIMNMPCQIQLVHGWTSLAIKVNIIAVPIFITAFFVVVPRFGGVGAAWLWVALNALSIPFVIYYMHRRILLTELWHWCWSDLLLPISGSVVVMAIAKFFQPIQSEGRLQWFFFLSVSGFTALAASCALATEIRALIATAFRRMLPATVTRQNSSM
ncbi:oligosaccharide flippase family protein [Geomonas propionica]|uniref:Oligosaccharide flippase family protein n=1 Tax=Geomonas propionica TaxID=2798582 RepID=A0ABS0YVG7_9BACT|nr:oligosaccharide flippase family protein [Geomonas propionica]MBJ6801933.1 oligosaccharide flippase family protein [Geomonas propionica]